MAAAPAARARARALVRALRLAAARATVPVGVLRADAAVRRPHAPLLLAAARRLREVPAAGVTGTAELLGKAKTLGHLLDLAALLGAEERDADAGRARAAGPAGAVDVGVGVLGRVEVDDVRDA